MRIGPWDALYSNWEISAQHFNCRVENKYSVYRILWLIVHCDWFKCFGSPVRLKIYFFYWKMSGCWDFWFFCLLCIYPVIVTISDKHCNIPCSGNMQGWTVPPLQYAQGTRRHHYDYTEGRAELEECSCRASSSPACSNKRYALHDGHFACDISSVNRGRSCVISKLRHLDWG